MADWYKDPKFTSGSPLRRSLIWGLLAGILIAGKFAIAFWLYHR